MPPPLPPQQLSMPSDPTVTKKIQKFSAGNSQATNNLKSTQTFVGILYVPYPNTKRSPLRCSSLLHQQCVCQLYAAKLQHKHTQFYQLLWLKNLPLYAHRKRFQHIDLCILCNFFLFLCDTLMMVAEATETSMNSNIWKALLLCSHRAYWIINCWLHTPTYAQISTVRLYWNYSDIFRC
jgi:hypothetical protein